jgi:hypothetical protein
MSNNIKKIASVYVLQIAHTGKDKGAIPPTNLVYGNKDALTAGIKRLFENERRRLTQLAEFEKELGRDVDTVWSETTDAGSFYAWNETFKWQHECGMIESSAIGTLNGIPDEFKIYEYRLTEERVNY